MGAAGRRSRGRRAGDARREIRGQFRNRSGVGAVSGRAIPTAVTALLALASVCFSAARAVDDEAPLPNIVLVLTDDQGYGDLGLHGHPLLRTPHIDAFASEAIAFSNFHVSPTCSPTRAALLTGRDANRTGVWHTAAGRGLLRRDEVTVAEMLRQAGYATAIFGKWHLGSQYPFRPGDRGFEEAFTMGGGGTGDIADFWNNTNIDPVMNHNGQPVPTEGFITDTLFDRAVEFIDASSEEGRPFFVLLSTNAPHATYNAPLEDAERYRDQPVALAHFFGMIENIDHNFGRLRHHLGESGLENDTILMFMTDNGTAIGHPVFAAGLRGHKASEYEGGHRAPFFFRWPAGGMVGPHAIRQLAAHVDIAPTLLDLAGIRPKAALPFDGVSLRPLLQRREAGWPDRPMVVDSQRILEPRKWKQSSVMSQRWRLVNGTELYDIEADPGQARDVAGRHPDVVGSLRDDYEAWWNGLAPTFADTPRIVIDSRRQYMTRLVTGECLSSGLPAWGQAHVRAARQRVVDDCAWAVDVERPGPYIVELRRWPRELNHPIRAGLPPGEPIPGGPTHRDPPGESFAAVRASLVLGADAYTVPVGEGDRSARFQVELRPGKAMLTATFEDDAGTILPSYYAYLYPQPSAPALDLESRVMSDSGPQGWWQADLGSVHDIESITLHGCGTGECPEAPGDFYVFVAEEDPAGRPFAALTRDPGIWRRFFIGEAGESLEIPVGAAGRYVRIQQAREGAPALAQLEVRGSAVEAAEAEGDSPNIVLILADDLGLGEVRSYTNTAIAPVDSPVPTPAIDRLAEEGLRFTNAHSPSAVCSPTRYGLLTGRYAWRTRLKAGTVVMHAPSLIDPDEQTLAELLGERGYATAMFGKWHLGLDWATTDGEPPSRTGDNVDYSRPYGGGPVAHGFDTYFGDDTINFPPFTWMEDDRVTAVPNEPVLKDEVLYGFRAEGYEFVDVLPETVRRSVDYIRDRAGGDRPFFLYLSLTAPHAPIVPPERVPADTGRGMSEFARDDGLTLYSNFLRLVDWSVEQVLRTLDATGIAEDTLVIFTSDNGAAKPFASHDHISPGFVDGVLLRGQKADAFEGGHRIPLLFRWPGRIEAARVSDALVELNDIYRSVAEIVGVEALTAGGQDSIGMAPLLFGDTGESGPQAPRTYGVNHSHRGGFAIRRIDADGREWKLIFGGQAAGGFSGGTPFDPFTAIGDTFDFETHLQLYDLTTDPGESNDLLKDGVSEAELELVLALLSRLQAFIESGQSRVH
ncbi:MAG: sulfatase-like hydrolase/transferase [Proteobacteria bacterium]|nr:sulfatase-like hydrolase/transferase [Pseudomonadota bacterium]